MLGFMLCVYMVEGEEGAVLYSWILLSSLFTPESFFNMFSIGVAAT